MSPVLRVNFDADKYKEREEFLLIEISNFNSKTKAFVVIFERLDLDFIASLV